MQKFLILIGLLTASHILASQQDAERIKRTFELSQESWTLKMKIAKTVEERNALWGKRPSPEDTAVQLWSQIASSLNQDWCVPYSAFYLNLTHQAAPNSEQFKHRQQIIDLFEASQIDKPNIGPFCIALIQSGSPRALPLLEKVSEKNPDQKIQGIASLGAALLLKSLGDEPAILERRLNHLRKSIIQAVDEKIGDSTVASVAADEIFIIRYLIKGRTPPEFSGTDVGGRIIKSSDLNGKICILMFWDSNSPELKKIFELTNELVDKYAGKPVSIIGITSEPLAAVRNLQANETVKWNNVIDSKDEIAALYRIKSRPAVLVIDASGKLEYTGLPGSFIELTVDALLHDQKPKR